MELLLLLPLLLCVVALADLVSFVWRGRRLEPNVLVPCQLFALAIIPTAFLPAADLSQFSECCRGHALFAPDHRLSVYAVMLWALGAYAYARADRVPGPPIPEVLAQCGLLVGLAFVPLLALQVGGSRQFGGPEIASLGLVPPFTLGLTTLLSRQRSLS